MVAAGMPTSPGILAATPPGCRSKFRHCGKLADDAKEQSALTYINAEQCAGRIWALYRHWRRQCLCSGTPPFVVRTFGAGSRRREVVSKDCRHRVSAEESRT